MTRSRQTHRGSNRIKSFTQSGGARSEHVSPLVTRKRSAALRSPEGAGSGVLKAIVATVKAAKKRVTRSSRIKDGPQTTRSGPSRSSRSRGGPATPVPKSRGRSPRAVLQTDSVSGPVQNGKQRTRNSLGLVSRTPKADEVELDIPTESVRQSKRLKATHTAVESGLLDLDNEETQNAPAIPSEVATAPGAPPGTPQREFQPSWDAFMTSVGPCPSQSLRDSILKSPTPPRRTTINPTPRMTRVVRMLIPPVDLIDAEIETRSALQAEQQDTTEQHVAERNSLESSPLQRLPEPIARTELAQLPDVAPQETASSSAAVQSREPEPEGLGPAPSSSSTFPRAGLSGTIDATSAAPWWDPLDPLKVRQVRAVLHTAYQPSTSAEANNRIPVCRDEQISLLRSWLSSRFSASSCGGSCYVSGPPGTGKTLTMLGLLRDVYSDLTSSASANAEERANCAGPIMTFINCMRLTNSRQVAKRALEAMSLQAIQQDPIRRPTGVMENGTMSDEEALSKLHSLVLSSRNDRHKTLQQRMVLVLDELDGLLDGSDRGESLVEDLFALAHAPGSNLLILAIANSIDLVQRLLQPGGPFSRRNLRPEHITFPAYTADAIQQILRQRVETLPGEVFEPRSLELCARKVANGSGDMRLALEAASAALELATQAAEHDEDLGLAVSHQLNPAGLMKKSTVSLRDMATALSTLTGGVGVGSAVSQAVLALPPPQQLVLAAMLQDATTSRRLSTGQPPAFTSMTSQPGRRASLGGGALSSLRPSTLGMLWEVHGKLALQVGIGSYSQHELASVVDVLADHGLLTLGPRRGSVLQRRVSLKVAEEDVLQSLRGIPVIGGLLERNQPLMNP